LFSYVSAEARVPPNHPLRLIRAVVDEALEAMSEAFDALYAQSGRPSVPPEKLIRALLLQAFFSIRSERQLVQQLDYNLLFRWFVGLAMDAPVWDATTFSKNRDRLLEIGIARQLLAAVLAQPRVAALMSDEHFSVDGTLIQAWASHKSFKPKQETAPRDGDGPQAEGHGSTQPAPDQPSPRQPSPRQPSPQQPGGRNAERDFRGEKRSNETHASVTDPDARLARKSSNTAAILAYAGHVLMENRHGLVAQEQLTHATGRAEREAALLLLDRTPGCTTLGADKGYDATALVEALVERGIAPHIARDTHASTTGRPRRSAVPQALAETEGYQTSQRVRKRIEEVFGWIKQSAGLRQTRHRGIKQVSAVFSLTVTAYNLIRLPKLLGLPA
jgi:transposase